MRSHRSARFLLPLLGFCLSLLLPASASAVASVPPTIANTHVSDVTTTSVTLNAEINPQGKGAKYRFEYGPADCASNPCTSVPEGEGNIGVGSSFVPVSFKVEGLSPGAAYHYRVVSKNGLTPADLTEGPDKLFATYPLDPLFGPCPNDPFREGKPSGALPDCRAYEQASPTDKNGLDVTGTYYTVKSSPTGEAVSFFTTSGIPAEGGTQEPPLYLASRAESNWSTRGLLPPETYAQRANVEGWTPDFSQVFSWGLKFGAPDTSAVLSLAPDGSLTEVVPYDPALPKFELAGASADGSKVFFETFGVQLTPDAVSGKNNLYLWNRDTGSLALVGLLPDSACGSPPCAPPGGSVAGPYNWVKGTNAVSLTGGGALSSYYTQDQHAISSDGQSAYFTAGQTGQLYRRTGIGTPGAATSHVSASEKTNGKGDEGHDANGARPAAFMAATPDGKTAFFTSSEKLTDDATTGPEPDSSPAIARSDVSGTPASVDLDFLPTNAFGLALGSEHIYWTYPDEGTIGRAKLNGDDPEEEFITGADNPQYVAIDAEHVYWTNAGDGEVGNGTIGRAELGPSEAEEIEQDFITGATNPKGIDVDSEYVYWANSRDDGPIGGATDPTRAIGRADLDGAPASVEQEFIPIGGGAHEHRPQGIAVNASHVYTVLNSSTEQESASIRRLDLDGDPASLKSVFDSVHKGLEGLRGLAIDASHVYWARNGQDTIGRINLELDEASIEREFIKDAGHPGGLAVDASHLYWSANQEVLPNPGNDLYRYDAGKPATERLTDLVVDTSDENGAEVRGVLGTSDDGSHVYFVANGVPDGVTGSPNAQGELATPGGTCPQIIDGNGKGLCNLYLAHEGEIEFIARVEDEANWTGSPTGGVGFGDFYKTSRVSADGRTLLFSSRRQLTAYDNTVFDEEGKPVDKRSELYLYRADEPDLLCVSCNPTGARPVDAAITGIFFPTTSPENPASTLSRSLSVDGDRVFFESTDPLLAADTNGEAGCPVVGSETQSFSACQDVYMWEAKGSGSCESEAQNGGCLYLISTGKSDWPSFFADASEDGDDVLFMTRSGLVGQDGDQLLDVYDARVGGGLASQNEAPLEPCEGDACKPGATPPPTFQSAGSAAFSGPPNPKARKPKPRCPKGKRKARAKGKTRCVAKKQRKNRKRNAKKTGRAGR